MVKFIESAELQFFDDEDFTLSQQFFFFIRQDAKHETLVFTGWTTIVRIDACLHTTGKWIDSARVLF